MESYRLQGLSEKLSVRVGQGCSETDRDTVWLTRKEGSSSELHEICIEGKYRGVYGMGERFDGLNQKGKTVVGEVIEKFCHQGEKTYLSIPFFVTDTGLGIYVETWKKTRFIFGETICCEIPAESCVHVFSGTIKEVISAFMRLTGEAKLPPEYAFGIWISANHWKSEADVNLQLSLLEQYHFPASVMVLEAWSDEATFYIWNGASYQPLSQQAEVSYDDFDFSKSTRWKNPKAMIDTLHKKGIRLVLWQIPVYKEQEKGEEKNEQLARDKEYALAEGLCVKNEDGSPYRIPEGNWFSGSMVPDFSNPKTVKSWFDKRRYLLEMGVDGFKTDGGEFIYKKEVRLHNKMDGTEAKNFYAQMYTQAYTEFEGNGHVLFSRAGSIGAHTTPIHWAGDQQSENRELRSVLAAGLSAAMTGIPFWSFDIGGFAGPLPSTDLYRRATALACFIPVMQWHSEPDGGQFRELLPGGAGNNERSPWNLAKAWDQPELLDEIRFWHCLRMQMVPHLYSIAIDCCKRNRPMISPLVYEYSQEEAVLAEDEFMLGDSILVAPLLEENETVRGLWLPPGEWIQLFSHKRIRGGSMEVSSPDDRFPVYLKAGRAILMRSQEEKSGYHFWLAGTSGMDQFYDDTHCISISWKDGEAVVTGADDLHVTWESL